MNEFNSGPETHIYDALVHQRPFVRHRAVHVTWQGFRLEEHLGLQLQ